MRTKSKIGVVAVLLLAALLLSVIAVAAFTDYVVAITGLGIPNTTATKYIKVADLPYQLLITGTMTGANLPATGGKVDARVNFVGKNGHGYGPFYTLGITATNNTSYARFSFAQTVPSSVADDVYSVTLGIRYPASADGGTDAYVDQDVEGAPAFVIDSGDPSASITYPDAEARISSLTTEPVTATVTDSLSGVYTTTLFRCTPAISTTDATTGECTDEADFTVETNIARKIPNVIGSAYQWSLDVCHIISPAGNCTDKGPVHQYLRVKAVDNASNVTWSSIVHIILDNRPFQISSLTPTGGLTYEWSKYFFLKALVNNNLANTTQVQFFYKDTTAGGAVTSAGIVTPGAGDQEQFAMAFDATALDFTHTYEFSATVTRSAGTALTASLEHTDITFFHPQTDFSAGWNMVSIPLQPESYLRTVVLGSDRFSTTGSACQFRWVTWVYNAATGVASKKEWTNISPGATTLDAVGVKDGQGYMVWSNCEWSLTSVGTFMTPMSGSPNAYSFYKGWNLIGYRPDNGDITFSNTPHPHDYFINSDLASNLGGLYEVVYGWDAASQSYMLVDWTGGELGNFGGYWVVANAAGKINPPYSVP